MPGRKTRRQARNTTQEVRPKTLQCTGRLTARHKSRLPQGCTWAAGVSGRSNLLLLPLLLLLLLLLSWPKVIPSPPPALALSVSGMLPGGTALG